MMRQALYVFTATAVVAAATWFAFPRAEATPTPVASLLAATAGRAAIVMGDHDDDGNANSNGNGNVNMNTCPAGPDCDADGICDFCELSGTWDGTMCQPVECNLDGFGMPVPQDQCGTASDIDPPDGLPDGQLCSQCIGQPNFVPCDHDGNACTVDLCFNEQCFFVACELPGVVCDDGDPCTTNDTCDGACNCLAGPPVDCSGLTDDCNIGVCNATTGACEA
ncbi:MAG: hypothetical protein ACE5E6_01940, partial [Phycisphaerae bacterium]